MDELIIITALIGAVTGLLASICSFLKLLIELKKLNKSAFNKEGIDEVSRKSVRLWKVLTAGFFVLSMLSLVGVSVTHNLSSTTGIHQPQISSWKNELWTTEAWMHFKEGEKAVLRKERDDKAFQDAIRVAQLCVNEFAFDARVEQKKLIDENVPEPKARYETEGERAEVHARGELNSVGTCYYIIGRTWEHLAETSEVNDSEIANAKFAYEEGRYFVHAATWDPTGEFFWFPGKKAEQRLKKLEDQASQE